MARKSVVVTENLLSYIFLPGFVAHELSHLVACKITGVEFLTISFSRPENFTDEAMISRNVLHKYPENRITKVFIPLAPLLFNSGLALWLAIGSD